ncbi:MAG TPA: exodeoxyribonuclease VII large subunit, partial [Acetobacteraceae bacterium]|nr:exodeoxyribonuclease VII large subunit [Acetobacteraceae bacterium]
DTTLIDHVSDRRAPTPTAAAEMAVPARVDMLADLAHSSARLAGALARSCHVQRLRLDRAAGALPDLPALLGAARQRIDDRAERLALALPNYVAARRAALERLGGRLLHPREVMAAKRHAVELVAHRLEVPLAGRLREARVHLDGLSGRLETVSYNATLARGFALVTNARGAALTSAREIAPGQAVSIHFHDGEVPARALPVQGRLDL